MTNPKPKAPAKAPPKQPVTLHSRLSLARRLRLQHLVVFEKVVEAGSILAASRELAMTQPAVSKSIHELEQQLNGLLFTRSKRGVVLTEFGSVFERHAKSMLAELRYMAEDLNDWQSGSSGHVIVGALIAASATLLPEAIARLRKVVPDVVVTLRVGPNSTLFAALARGELDVVVGFLPEDASVLPHEDIQRTPLTHVPLYEEALRVVVGSGHVLARRRKLRLLELQAFDWIVPTRDSDAYASVKAFFEKEGLQMPTRVVESVSILTNLGLLSNGSAVALMPQSSAERFEQVGMLSILPLEGPGPIGEVGYTLRADRVPSAAAQRFLDALEDAGRAFQKSR